MSKRQKVVITLLLIGVALSERLIFDLGPNIELVTTTSLLAAVYLGFPYCLLVPLVSLAISDTFIGNTNIFLFTWSAYVILGAVALLLRRFSSQSAKLIVSSSLFTLPSSIFFYLWTNFGVWLQGWYPPTFSGLMQSYLMGIPFLKLNLVGNLILVPTIFSIAETAKILREKIIIAESKVEA